MSRGRRRGYRGYGGRDARYSSSSRYVPNEESSRTDRYQSHSASNSVDDGEYRSGAMLSLNRGSHYQVSDNRYVPNSSNSIKSESTTSSSTTNYARHSGTKSTTSGSYGSSGHNSPKVGSSYRPESSDLYRSNSNNSIKSNGNGSAYNAKLNGNGSNGATGNTLIKGTDPRTGVNPFDGSFTKLLHHSDYTSKFPYSREIDPRKNYKVLYDPELDQALSKAERKTTSKKIRFNGDSVSSSELVDPRSENVTLYFQRPNKKSKKFPFKQLPQPKFVFDKDSLGPAPQTELVVWDLPSTTSEIYLTNYFKSYGDPIKDMKFINDPMNAVPLGIATFKFSGNPEKAMRLAKKFINTMKIEHAKVDGVELKIALNDNDNELLKQKIDLARDKLRVLRNKREEEEKKRLRRLQEVEEQHKKEEKKRKEEEQRKNREEEKKKKELQQRTSNTGSDGSNSASKSSSSSKDKVEGFKYLPNTSTLSIRHHNKIVPGVFLPKDLSKYIKERPYLLIHDKYVSTKKVTSQDIKRALNKYDWTRVLSDRTGFYIVFNTIKECERCFLNEDGRKFFEYRLYMELAIPEGFKSSETTTESEIADSKESKNDVIEEATNMLIKEFESFLAKDIRERIIAPAVLDLLSHDKYPKLVEELKAKEAISKPTSIISSSNQLKQDALSLLASRRNQIQQSLPSFKKKAESPKKSKALKKSLIPMQHALNYDHDSDDEEEDSSRSATPVSQALKRERSSTSTSISNDEDADDEHAVKKQKKTGLQKSFLYESSSDEEMEEEEEEEEQHDKENATEAVSDKPTDILNSISVKEDEVNKSEDKEEEDEAEIDYSKVEAKYQPTERRPFTVYEETVLLPREEFDLDLLQDIIKDEEDVALALQVLKELNPEPSKISNIDYWAWKQRDIKSASQEIVEDLELIEKLDSRLESKTGAFRSEGYHKINDIDKAEYLPHRRKVHKPLQTVQHEEDEEESSNRPNETSSSNNAIQSSRVNRANNRRFAADITAQLGNETEVLSLNTLTKRKKPVSFARSAIHNWGLYALEPIAAKEMIIEYVGESIRQQVAENREKGYLKTGIGSSYLFRIDENTVIDATKKGGIARFINHCCSPSCTAKIIKVEGEKRIVIYALRDIEANEELTYDYKFERETNDEERIRCLCGAPGCKGYLN
ncbi:histone methyltransferase [Scheffersomyces xylosifermentans]|uniref:histone methyltransferase n=1 Tax=Scheffersomyces xylosifermentans TaxID=1304137 RepID=UPI00315D9922